MICRILPSSRDCPRTVAFQRTDMTGVSRLLGAWDRFLDSLCAREGRGYCVHQICARVIRLFPPILPKREKKVKIQELISLGCPGIRGSMGGWT